MNETGKSLHDQMQEAAAALRAARPGFAPRTAIILGTGLGGLVHHLEQSISIPYSRIPHLAQPTVMEHEGKLWLGELEQVPVLVFQGRFHHYEGFDFRQITFPVRIAQAMGCTQLIVSNVAGGINSNFRAGDLVAITDHINLLGTSPLVGPNDARLGQRFPDMVEPYSADLLEQVAQVALAEGLSLQRGVYACMSGPQLETRAEYRMLRNLGADLIGMSTVPEVIVAVHADMKVLGLSVVTDECDPDALQPADLQKIVAHAMAAEPRLVALVRGVLRA